MDGFNFSTPLRVRAADLDYRGHVSNAAVLEMFQESRIGYLANLGGYQELNIGNHCGIIQREAHVHFTHEMLLGDELQIGVKVTGMRKTGFVMTYQIEKNGKVMAEGTTLLFAFDYEARKLRRLPTLFQKDIEKFEGLQLTSACEN